MPAPLEKVDSTRFACASETVLGCVRTLKRSPVRSSSTARQPALKLSLLKCSIAIAELGDAKRLQVDGGWLG